jgi:rhamnosyltransferase
MGIIGVTALEAVRCCETFFAVAEGSVADVCALIVTYRPDSQALNGLLHSLEGQVGASLIVDNTDTGERPVVDASRPVIVLPQATNVGLSQAQNIGIAWARRHGYRYVLLLDQDSMPGPGMVAALREALERLSEQARVAAVGPRFHDLREAGDAPFVRVRFPFNRKLWCRPGDHTVSCDFLISSGALIPLRVLDDVGEMDAGLFIDNVDLEWSFRARSKGYALHGVCAATMRHHLGDARTRLPFGLGQVTVHGPSRLYYIMRNRVRLYRMRHTPRAWVAQDLPRALAKLLLFALVIGPRGRNLRWMVRGLWDGWQGREGPSPQ